MSNKYLWVSRHVGSTGSVLEHIRKYFYNDPLNWLKYNDSTGVWESSPNVPGTLSFSGPGNDTNFQVFVGHENNLVYGKNTAGWTYAKNPLLFGGYSGSNKSGATAGSWAQAGGISFVQMQSFIHMVGVTRTSGGMTSTTGVQFSPYKQLEQIFDYPFPYLGGGITGEIAEWCAARDGLSADVYTTSYYGGYFRPENGLVIRPASMLAIEDLRGAGLKGITSTQNKFIADLKLIEYPTNPFYNDQGTQGWIYTLNGSGVRIEGGDFGGLNINVPLALNSGVDNPWFLMNTFNAPIGGPASAIKYRDRKYSDLVDHGIVIKNALINYMAFGTAQTVTVSGGDVGRMLVYPVPYGVSRELNLGNNGYYNSPYNGNYSNNPFTGRQAYLAGAPAYLMNGWDWFRVWQRWVNFGGGGSGNPDEIQLSSTRPGLFAIGFNGLTNVGNDIHKEPGRQQRLLFPGNTLVGNLPGNVDPFEFAEMRHDIVLGNKDDQTFLVGPTSGMTGLPDWHTMLYCVRLDSVAGSFEQYPRWRLQFASPARIQNLIAESSDIQPHPLLGATSSVRIGMMHLGLNSKFDSLGKDIRVGGMHLAGASANIPQIWGGIFAQTLEYPPTTNPSLDFTNNKIKGVNSVYWVGGLDGYRNLRLPSGEVNVPSTPESRTLPLTGI